jgi:hypothetical protein
MNKLKTLYWDCETSPNLALVWALWDQNIGLSQLLESGEMLCFSAFWEDAPNKPIFYSEWEHGKQGMVEALWALLSEADVAVTYNGKKFDTQWGQTCFFDLELTPPAPYRQIDIYQVVKSQFRLPSYKLEYVAQRFLGYTKIKNDGFALWLGVMNGDPKAQLKMKKYCIKDTKLLIPLKKKLLPWIARIPSQAVDAGPDQLVCIACQSPNLRREGYAVTTTRKYQRYQCTDCGKWNRDTRCVPNTSVGITETPIS